MGRAEHHGYQPGCVGGRSMGRPNAGVYQNLCIGVCIKSPQDHAVLVQPRVGAHGVRDWGCFRGDVEGGRGNARVGDKHELCESDGQLEGVGSYWGGCDNAVRERGCGDDTERVYVGTRGFWGVCRDCIVSAGQRASVNIIK